MAYSLPDPWQRKLFLALCRRYELKPYREYRQRMSGCFNAGYLLEHGIAGRRDAHCALAMYRYACDGGYAHGCLVAGHIYKGGGDIPADPTQAALVFKKACEAGSKAGCTQLGIVAPAAASASASTAAPSPTAPPATPSTWVVPSLPPKR